MNRKKPQISVIFDKDIVLSLYYNVSKKLNTRIRTWRKYGKNKIFFQDWLKQKIKEHVKKNKINYLDVGCGTGDLVEQISKNECFEKIVGIDISPSMIKLCKNKVNKKNVEFQIANIEDLKFSDNLFDIITCIHVMHHVQNIRKALSELSRVLKPNGVIIITTFDDNLNQGLNKLHYLSLNELKFPKFMKDTKNYLRFSNNKALKILSIVFDNIKRSYYNNQLVFRNSKPAMDYYTTAMIYRNSRGREDKRIGPKKWSQLYNLVKDKIDLIINKKKKFVSDGRVACFVVRKLDTQKLNLQLKNLSLKHRRKMMQIKKSKYLPKSNNIESSLNLPGLQAYEILKFIQIVKSNGYDGFCCGLTSLWKQPKELKNIKKIQKSIKLNACHGTSIKLSLKTGNPYKEILKKDLQVLQQIDPDNKVTINYDLFAGKETDLHKTFHKTRNENIKTICNKLNINHKTEKRIISRIINDISIIYKETGRKIVFEIPGSLGWSMLPCLKPNMVNYIIKEINKQLPNASICIDLPHLYSWQKVFGKELINNFFKTIKQNPKCFTMMHIANQGSNDIDFISLYHLVYGKNIPSWFINGLDLMLPIDDTSIIKMIKQLRDIGKESKIIEVSEVRPFGETVKDYFDVIDYNFTYRGDYFKLVRLQARMLGYKK